METNYKDRRIIKEPRLPVFVKAKRKGPKTNLREKLPMAMEWAQYWRRARKCWLWYFWQWFETRIIDRWEGSHGWPWLEAVTTDDKYWFFLSYADRQRMFYLSKAGEFYQYDFN